MNHRDAPAFDTDTSSGMHLTVHPMTDRTLDRMKIKSTLDEQARAKGFADYTAELDADYEAWRARHTQTGDRQPSATPIASNAQPRR